MQPKLTIQERLKDLRVERGLTLEQLSAETGISKSALGKYEADDFKDISPFSMVELAKFYGVSTDYLLELEPEKKPAGDGGREINDAELKFALWGDCADMSDEDLADVRRYAAFIRERKKEQP